MADTPRPIDTAPSARAAAAAAEAAHTALIARITADLEHQEWAKLPAADDDAVAEIRRAASDAARDLERAVHTTVTRDGAVMVALGDSAPPNPLREHRDHARDRRTIDDAFGRPQD